MLLSKGVALARVTCGTSFASRVPSGAFLRPREPRGLRSTRLRVRKAAGKGSGEQDGEKDALRAETSSTHPVLQEKNNPLVFWKHCEFSCAVLGCSHNITFVFIC